MSSQAASEIAMPDPSDRGAKLADKCETVAFSKYRLLEAVKGARDIEVLEDDGKPSTNLIYQMREEGENRWLFLCHVNRTEKISDACIVINELQERKKNQDLPRRRKASYPYPRSMEGNGVRCHDR